MTSPSPADIAARRRAALVQRRVKRRMEGLFWRIAGTAGRALWRPRRRSLAPPRRILLLLRAQRFGDAVVAMPFSRAVRHVWPEAEIWAAGTPVLAEVLSCDRSLTGFVPMPGPEWRRPAAALHRLRMWRRRFDLAFVLGIHFASTLWARWAAGYAVGYSYNRRGFLLDLSLEPHISCNRSGWEYGAETHPPHITAFWGRLLSGLTADNPRLDWDHLDLTAPRARLAARLPDLPAQRPRVGFHPWAGNRMRSWPQRQARGFLEKVLERTDWQIVLTGGREDFRRARRLAAGLAPRVFSAVGRLGPAQTWALLDGMDLVVSVDTGIAHMAAAAGRPVVSLFGSSDPLVWGPFGQADGVVQTHRACQRCKRSSCLHPGLPCMTAIEPAQVLAAAVRKLAAARVDTGRRPPAAA